MDRSNQPDSLPHPDYCDGCGGDFRDGAIEKMTPEQVALLEANICPYCERKLI